MLLKFAAIYVVSFVASKFYLTSKFKSGLTTWARYSSLATAVINSTSVIVARRLLSPTLKISCPKSHTLVFVEISKVTSIFKLTEVRSKPKAQNQAILYKNPRFSQNISRKVKMKYDCDDI